jgi:SAM-dependent methyltransferase
MSLPPHRHATLEPSPWIARHAHLIRSGARVLDVAAGEGRHARLFAARGASVLAVDHDGGALAALAGVRGVTTRILDLEAGSWPLSGERFDAIVVCHYLHRPLFPHLRAALADDGVLLYETFAQGQAAHGRPTRRDFLLRPGELLELAAFAPPLTVVAFEQGRLHEDGRIAVTQRLAAVGPGCVWPPQLDNVPG